MRKLFFAVCSLFYSAVVWAQSTPLGTFTDGQSLTIELQQTSSGLQGSMVIMGLDERIPMEFSQQGGAVVATANFFGEVMAFTLSPSGDNLMVTAGGEQALFQRVGAAPSANSPGFAVSESLPMAAPSGQPDKSNAQPSPASFSNSPVGSGSELTGIKSSPSSKLNEQFLEEVEEPYAGFAFKPLKDWRGGKNEDVGAYVYGSDTKAGFLIVFSDESTGNTVKSYQQWISSQMAAIQPGVTMQLASECQSYGSEVVFCDFSGRDQAGTQLRALAAAKIANGRRFSATSFTTTEAFKQGHVDRAIALASSARFFKPKPVPVDEKWIQSLSGRKLTYMSSSSSSSYDGSSTSSSTRESYGFCPDGTFYQKGSDSYSVSAGQGSGSQVGSGSSAMGRGNGRSEGRWTVLLKGNQSILKLTYSTGSVAEKHIYKDDGKTYMDGTRYFRTGGTYGEGPDCG
jgi:hypothetical protein